MTSISEIIKQKRAQALGDTPNKPKDYITQKIEEHLNKLDSNVGAVLSKNPLNINVSKSGKCTRFELQGKPLEIETVGEITKIPVSLIVYEDKEGVKNAWYAATDAKGNRVVLRHVVIDHEVQMS